MQITYSTVQIEGTPLQIFTLKFSSASIMAAGENGQTEFPYKGNLFHSWRKRLKCLSHLIHIISCAKFSHISPAVCILVWKSQTQYHICVNFPYWLPISSSTTPPPLWLIMFLRSRNKFHRPQGKTEEIWGTGGTDLSSQLIENAFIGRTNKV